MKSTMLTGFILICTIAASYVSCAKKADVVGTAPSTSGGGGSAQTSPLTAAEVAGTHYAPCLSTGTGNSYGTSSNNMSFLRSLTLNSDLTYSIGVFFFTGTTCQVGGTEIFVYAQTGTYSLGALTTSPSGSTEVTYTVASSGGSQLTVYGGAGGPGGVGSGWATSLNNGCPGGPVFSTSGTSTASVSGRTCNTNGLSFPQFGSDSDVYLDVISLDSITSPTSITMYPSNDVFHPGQFSSFPSTSSLIYSF